MTIFDAKCHRIMEHKNGEDYLAKPVGVNCDYCGNELVVYYCEDRLYFVECEMCRKKALTEALSPKMAAFLTFGVGKDD